MRIIVFLIFILHLTNQLASAQVQLYPNQFRPSNQNWQQLKTDHFKIIYPASSRYAAFRTAKILENEYHDISSLIGGNLNNFRVILNAENDLSNGFVNPLNFRTEIELAPIKGKSLNPRSGDWLETVSPHELVHAVHFNSKPKSLTNLVGLFSPDIRRSIHSAAPFGILEGVAVEYESHNHIHGSGRGNYPFFTNQFQSLLGTSDEWSMGQLIHVSDFTFPFDRHYSGGYHFTHWLLENEGRDIMQKTIDHHYRWPFLGFGFALRQTTGKYPSQLYREFNDEMRRREMLRRASVLNHTDSVSKILSLQTEGTRASRPRWLDNNRILYYSRSYNSPTGFYIYDIEKNKDQLLKEVVLVEDIKYSLAEDKSAIYYGRYKTDLFFDNTMRSNIYKFDLKSGKSTRITVHNDRIFAPELSEERIYAVRTDVFENRPVILNRDNGSIINSFSLPDGYTVQEFSVHPQYPGLIAILARKSGVQALWIVEPDKIASFYHNDPDIVFDNGSVFDPQWHPVQPLLLFTSDFTGVMNIYQYDSQLNTVHQITNSLFNSMEASYSPDGDKLIYIHQTQNLRLPAVLEKNLFYNKKVDPVFWKPSEDVKNRINRPLMNRAVQPDTTQWVNEKYQTGIGWLKPRLWTPVIRNTGDVRQIGLRFYSTDDLAQNTYSFEITRAQNRLWYDLNYRFSGFFPGFGIAAKSEPLFPSLRVEDDTGQSRIFNFMLEDREFGINIPFRLLLERNSRFSSLTVRPKYELTQLKFFDIGSSNRSLSNFSTIHSVGLTVVFNYRLRQFIRNVQPNAGWVLYAQTEIDLNNSDFDFTFQNIDFSGRFSDRRGLRGGIFRYVAPFSSKNHSLRFGLEFLTQTELPQFNNQDLVSDAFSGDVFRSSNNLSFLSTRYTIPLTHPDDGGFLLPLYLSNIYLVLFTQTVSDLNAASLSDIPDHSRTILGSGIRSRFRISNLAIDIGISFGFEPSRNDFTFLFGTF